MFEKFVKIVQQQSAIKFFLVTLLLAIMLVFTGYYSIYLGAAIILGLVPVFIDIDFLKDKLSYDQKQGVLNASTLLSSLFFALFMLQNLNNSPQIYSLVFSVICVSSIIIFNAPKQIIYRITPVLLIFVYLLIFEQSTSLILTAIMTILFIAILVAIKLLHIQTVDNDELTKTENGVDKAKFLAKIDAKEADNKELQSKLAQMEIDLSAAEMAKMEFLATMSHEIRTPLNGIIPLLDVLLDSELVEFQRDYISTAHSSAIQMQKLIDDLLDYSKIEAGKLTIETRGLKIPKILAAIKSSYKQAAEKKNISIEINTHANVSPLLRGDPTRLRQVLSNLLSNAIKFSSTGTIKVSAEKIKDLANKEVIRFAVVDQGIGLNKETSDTIFLPFTQEDGSSTRKFGGTGLGLAMSKQIVELMHGTIAVDSQKGKGSTFYFDLPLLKSMGETQIGIADDSESHAILINTNPLLFNKIYQELKEQKIATQKVLGLAQAYDAYSAINKNSSKRKNILMFLDFETAGKQARGLCHDLSKDITMNNIYACILTDAQNIVGIPQSSNIKLITKDTSISDVINRIEVIQAPSQKSDDANSEKTEQLSSLSTQEKDSLIPEILLVEDNEINLKVAEKLMQYIGYPFDFAMNGQEALEKVKNNRYRMILMDCQMPIMDGYTCTRKIREYEKEAELNHTPILAMTANAMIGDREKCLESGMDDYMSKPLNRFILEKTLKKWDPLGSIPSLEDEEQTEKIDDAKDDIHNPETTKIAAIDEAQTHIEVESSKAEESPATNIHTEINQRWLSAKSLKEIEEIMGDEAIDLLDMFKQETPKILAKIRGGLKNQDLNEVQANAHMLKSTSANIGANGLSFFSRKLELAATEKKSSSELIKIYTKTNKAYQFTQEEINKYINNASSQIS